MGDVKKATTKPAAKPEPKKDEDKYAPAIDMDAFDEMYMRGLRREAEELSDKPAAPAKKK